jgi:hypothetical protein
VPTTTDQPEKKKRIRKPDRRVRLDRQPLYYDVTRFMICPASGFLHAPLGSMVHASSRKRVPMTTCTCGTRTFPGTRWDPLYHGYLEAELRELGVATESQAIEETKQRGGGQRYVICPCSRFIHAGMHAIPVRLKNRFHCHCWGCSASIFMGSRWGPQHGYTLDQVKAMKATVDG